MIKTAVNSISAGILIAIGGSVYLACDNKYAGAALFSVALLCICYLGYYLFTGKIGYLATDRAKKNVISLALGLAVNLAVTFLLGMLIRFAMPTLGEKAATLCGAKLGQSFIGTFIRAVFLRSADVSRGADIQGKKDPDRDNLFAFPCLF